MRMIRNNNPVFRGLDQSTFTSGESATYGGIVVKTLGLFTIMFFTVLLVFWQETWFIQNSWILFLSMILGFVFVIWGSRTPSAAKITAPLYAVAEGILIGFISAIYSAVYPGIVESAVLITLSVFLMMLILYYTGLVRVGPTFRRVVTGALMGLVFFTFSALLISLFSSSFRTSFYGNINLILIISLVSAGIASLMILLDLDNCTRLVQSNAPKEYEWTASLGLLVTIVWLFIEILRILAIFASRRD